ncbi:PilZ domain-containing protein [Sphingopyxis sp. PET50]|uniref:PilZ domain-containing protein n=1 Tax=Sphingopyxis sp. PET50 TaxID=2976533 RepID=UPI0021AF7B0F|nr:PilZ domain-containing protein [Sphingopyxis sp. PET50]
MMTSSTPLSPRQHVRASVSIDVVVNGVLNMVEGRITDLSEGGARIEGGAILPVRSRCEIHYAGQTVYAIVMWAETDRMGVRFPYELTDGPLYNALDRARSAWPSEYGAGVPLDAAGEFRAARVELNRLRIVHLSSPPRRRGPSSVYTAARE